jgi:hypothetical protein
VATVTGIAFDKDNKLISSNKPAKYLATEAGRWAGGLEGFS